MKAARISSYANHLASASRAVATILLTDRDVALPLEAGVAAVLHAAPGTLHVVDFFELPDNTAPADVPREGLRRQGVRHQAERDMATMFYFLALILTKLKPGGTYIEPEPSPLTVEDARWVLLQLGRHPAYRRHVVVAFTEDRTHLGMLEGKVAKLPAADYPGLDTTRIRDAVKRATGDI